MLKHRVLTMQNISPTPVLNLVDCFRPLFSQLHFGVSRNEVVDLEKVSPLKIPSATCSDPGHRRRQIRRVVHRELVLVILQDLIHELENWNKLGNPLLFVVIEDYLHVLLA